LGGDEFVGLAVETGETTSDVILTRLQEHLNAVNIQETRPYKLSISYGIARYDPEKPCSLMRFWSAGIK
jgi:GGDEF domain-containing protein